jgi:tetratricopeptide (TPR) repeat protein
MRAFFPITIILVGSLAMAPVLVAQAAATGDQPHPGQKDAAQSQQPASNANPFPEDTRDVPVMPSKVAPPQPEGTSSDSENAPLRLAGADSDPVRSPDEAVPDDNGKKDSSSSLAGISSLLPNPEDDQPQQGKRKLTVKEPTHQESASKDIEVGSYYLERKNWKAALSRFESAMVLDPENPDVYWGMAEADRHLNDFTNARANYLKVLDYDSDGPHAKEARKALKDPALAAVGKTK